MLSGTTASIILSVSLIMFFTFWVCGRSSISKNKETKNAGVQDTKSGEEAEDYFIPDTQSLLQLREKYCIQCLQLLGEYVEVLGPVLHEKGVDVCLALLQQNSKHQEASKVDPLLPDVIKLICVLGTHRKFAARFVHRGGMQMLLAVPRMSQIFSFLSSFLVLIGSQQVLIYYYYNCELRCILMFVLHSSNVDPLLVSFICWYW